MPVRHSPAPPDATTPDTETLKRPTKDKQKANRVDKLPPPIGAESGSPTLQFASPAPDNPPESSSTPVSSAPKSPKGPKSKVQSPTSGVQVQLEETLDVEGPSLDLISNTSQGGIISVEGVDF